VNQKVEEHVSVEKEIKKSKKTTELWVKNEVTNVTFNDVIPIDTQTSI